MALQLSVAVRNARLDAIETQIGATAVLKIRTGERPVTLPQTGEKAVAVTQGVLEAIVNE